MQNVCRKTGKSTRKYLKKNGMKNRFHRKNTFVNINESIEMKKNGQIHKKSFIFAILNLIIGALFFWLYTIRFFVLVVVICLVKVVSIYYFFPCASQLFMMNKIRQHIIIIIITTATIHSISAIFFPIFKGLSSFRCSRGQICVFLL